MTKRLALYTFILLTVGVMSGMCSEQADPSLSSHYLIVADAPHLDKEQLAELQANKTIVVLDGAADTMQQLGVNPDVILGDFDAITDAEYWGITETFDAIDDDTPSYLGKRGVTIVPAKNQDLTDLEKGILYCDSQGAASIAIINATGGRMDHTLGNIRFLRKYHTPSRPLTIVTETQTLEYVRDGHTVIIGNVGDYCGIMAFPKATMTTTGLTYDVEDYPLDFGMSESICNSLKEPQAVVNIVGEALIIHPNHR